MAVCCCVTVTCRPPANGSIHRKQFLACLIQTDHRLTEYCDPLQWRQKSQSLRWRLYASASWGPILSGRWCRTRRTLIRQLILLPKQVEVAGKTPCRSAPCASSFPAAPPNWTFGPVEALLDRLRCCDQTLVDLYPQWAEAVTGTGRPMATSIAASCVRQACFKTLDRSRSMPVKDYMISEIPPSIIKALPVMKEAASEAR